MIRQNLHTHSTFSDGVNTPEEMVRAAIDKGFGAIGFSEHAYTPYDDDCCIREERIPAYLAEIARLKEQFADTIEVYTGFELDSHQDTPRDGLDYTIGSAHYLYDATNNAYYNVDYLPETFEKALRFIAGGDVQRLVASYYDNLLAYIHRAKPDIIGHLNLLTKLNANSRFFDESSTWYKKQVEAVAQAVAETGCIVELNTGGIARGYRTEPYPSRYFLGLLRSLHVPVTISSDAHAADHLDFWFDEAEALLCEVGYRSIKQLHKGIFVDVEL